MLDLRRAILLRDDLAQARRTIDKLMRWNERLRKQLESRAEFELSADDLPALLRPQCGPLHD